jgi:uncharacterized protein YtpQ (UPF0354 family)
MSFFRKIFGSKDELVQNNQEAPRVEKGDKTELSLKLNSIYPYFKQLLPSDDKEISERLPDDLSTVDNSKKYSVPGLKLIIRNICDDLNCLYVYDNETGLEIIQEKELKKLNISEQELHEIAMTNFRKLVSKRLNAQNNGETFWFRLDGNLEAGLVLVDEIWEQIEWHLKEPVVICVPARDVLIATGKSNNNVIEEFTEKSKKILLTGDHPLSKNWFIRENTTWKVFKKIID